MNKCKLVKGSGLTRLVIKSLKGQQVNEHELYAINCNKVPGLLHLDLHNKKSSFKLSYDITGFVSLKKFLQTSLNRESFGRILLSMLNILKGMQDAFFNQQCVLYDFNFAMVNAATKDVYLIYVPIQPFESPNTLREFLLGIIERASFVQDEDNDYVREYITILNRGINFSVFDLEQYVYSLLGQHKNENYIECPKCHEMILQKTSYCKCGMKINGASTDLGCYDPLKPNTGNISYDDDKPDYYDQPKPCDEPEPVPEEEAHHSSEVGTTVLGAQGGTTVLGAVDFRKKITAWLIREKTGEKIILDKNEFLIGKSKEYCDYAAEDNNAVSRRHAKIINRNDRFFIYDLKSTNKTYVNEKPITAEENYEIFAGNQLRLANENFTFNVE